MKDDGDLGKKFVFKLDGSIRACSTHQREDEYRLVLEMPEGGR